MTETFQKKNIELLLRRKKFIFVAVLILYPSLTIFYRCADKTETLNDNSFLLAGKVAKTDNGNWVYLSSLDGKIADSAQILNNKFELKGELNEPKEFKLFRKNNADFTSIWIEPGIITFNAEDSSFKNAKIVGSESQDDRNTLLIATKKFTQQRDSIANTLINQKPSDSLRKRVMIQMETIFAKQLKAEQGFIANHPDSYVSIRLLNMYSSTLGKDKTKELFDDLSDVIKGSSYGQEVSRFIALNNNIGVGDEYVDFSMKNAEGKTIKLSSFEGKVILLDFWASWCSPCIKEYPSLKKAYSKFQKKGFEIVSVSQDQFKEKWLNAIEKNQLNWVNLWDEKARKADPYLIYGINGIPDNFLIDKNGKIVARNLRGEDLMNRIESTISN